MSIHKRPGTIAPKVGAGSRPTPARVGLQEHRQGTPQRNSFLRALKEFLPRKLGF